MFKVKYKYNDDELFEEAFELEKEANNFVEMLKLEYCRNSDIIDLKYWVEIE
jgi:hypothetical protein